MKQLVKLWKRPSYDGERFTYYLLYTDEQRKRRQKSLGHIDARKAERQRAQLERELRMGIVEPCSMKLSEFMEDSINRTRGQVRENTIFEYESTMRDFIKVIGDIDFRKIEHKHGEQFIQACLDGGNRPATVGKKVGTMKRLFQLSVQRGQLEENPFRFLRKPKYSRQAIRVFTDEECVRMINVARQKQIGAPFRWDILFLTALCTGMRRGELLNTTWKDIDFAGEKINVSPKSETDYIWQWQIKDTDRRFVPLTAEVVQLLAEYQAEQPAGYPYVFVPPARYNYVQELRRHGKWNARKKLCPVSNFRRQFRLILAIH
jgi:integrase